MSEQAPAVKQLGNADPSERGAIMMERVRALYPIWRSITGAGLRETLDLVGEALPGFRPRSVASGTQVLDWTVPKEWNVRRAYLVGPDGRVVVDAADHNLHLLQYSVPIDRELDLDDLRPHLYSLPEQPDRIPYRTSYYQEAWGFCLRHDQLERLPEGRYHAVIDATLEDGVLDFGELLLPGALDDEVLLSAHVCHPSLANDNLSAVVVLIELGKALLRLPSRRYRYRLLFAPGTIGAISFLATTPEAVERTRHGIVLAGLGDAGPLHYKRSRDGAYVDRLVERVLAERGEYSVLPFTPDGYDERQYNSPGFRMPVGRLGRTPYATYPEYHTSGDDLSFVKRRSLEEALAVLWDVVTVLEHEGAQRNLAPYGEPQLGRRGLYAAVAREADPEETWTAVRWCLNLSDGQHGLIDIAERADLPLRSVIRARALLSRHGLLDRPSPPADDSDEGKQGEERA